MSARDAGFLYLERPQAPLHIGCLAVLDGGLGCEELARLVESRLPRMRRYAQRPVSVPFSLAHPAWEDDPAFDVRNHIRRWSLPAPGGEGELRELVATLLQQPLDRTRPLWEMHLIEGLDQGHCALLQKVHHCMIDGMAGAHLLEVLLDHSPAPPYGLRSQPEARELPRASVRIASALAEGARETARRTAAAVSTLLRPTGASEALAELRDAAEAALRLALDAVPDLPWNGPVGPRRQLAFTTLPMEGLQRIRAARSASINDVVLSVLAGGLQRYLEAVGVRTQGLQVTALVPVSLRSAPEARALGNRISAMHVPLVVDLARESAADLVHEGDRLDATRAITERLKTSRAWTGIDTLLSLADAAPPPLIAALAGRLEIGRLANLIVTNVPGPREARFLCSSQVRELYPIVPIAGGLGLGLAAFSYDGTLYLGLNADADRVPDLEKLRLYIEETFQTLLALS